MHQGRPMRADAARNRAKILDAADALIVAHGPEVPMDVIAESTGVAVGTLYRHFPTKSDLVRAVIEDHLDYMVVETEAAARRVRDGKRAIDEFAGFADSLLETAAHDKGVKAAAATIGADYDPGDRIDRMTTAVEFIIRSAKADGDVRDDLSIDDFYLVFATLPTDQPEPVRKRWLTLVIDGFRATGDRSRQS